MKWLCKCGWHGTADDAARRVRNPEPVGFKQDGHTLGSSRLMCPTCASVELRPMTKAERLEREGVVGGPIVVDSPSTNWLAVARQLIDNAPVLMIDFTDARVVLGSEGINYMKALADWAPKAKAFLADAPKA